MPTFEITTPDGRVFDITGETQEGALAALKDHLGDNGQEQPVEQPAPETEVDTSMRWCNAVWLRQCWKTHR